MSILARLTAGTTTKDPREGPGGFNALTAEDVNLAVSLLPPMDAAILLAAHIDQPPPPDMLLSIFAMLEREMCREWKKQKLGKVDLEKIETMAEIAWAEFCTNDRMSEEQKSIECDIPRMTWFRSYRFVYPAASNELRFIARRAYARVKHSLR